MCPYFFLSQFFSFSVKTRYWVMSPFGLLDIVAWWLHSVVSKSPVVIFPDRWFSQLTLKLHLSKRRGDWKYCNLNMYVYSYFFIIFISVSYTHRGDIRNVSKKKWGWRDSWVVRSSGCSSREFGLISQHPHDGFPWQWCAAQGLRVPVDLAEDLSSVTSNYIRWLITKGTWNLLLASLATRHAWDAQTKQNT